MVWNEIDWTILKKRVIEQFASSQGVIKKREND